MLKFWFLIRNIESQKNWHLCVTLLKEKEMFYNFLTKMSKYLMLFIHIQITNDNKKIFGVIF